MQKTITIFVGIIVIGSVIGWAFDRKSKNLALSEAIDTDNLDRFLKVRATRKRLQTKEANRTALYLAVFKNASNVFEHLLSSGVTMPGAYTQQNPDPVLCACVMKGRVHMLQRLLDAGFAPDAQSSDGDTPLHVMAKFGSCEKAKLLLDAGARRELRNADGKSPHDLAIEYKRMQIQELLLEKSP